MALLGAAGGGTEGDTVDGTPARGSAGAGVVVRGPLRGSLGGAAVGGPMRGSPGGATVGATRGSTARVPAGGTP
jgi:hypothetical protein